MHRGLVIALMAAAGVTSAAGDALATANPLSAAVSKTVAEPRIHVEFDGRCRDGNRLVACHYDADSDRAAGYDLSSFR